MAKQEKYSWLDELLESDEKSLGFMDLSTVRPMSWRHFHPLLSKEWIEWFWLIINAREEKSIPYEKLAEVMTPTICRDHLLFMLEDVKSARLPLEKRLQAADFFYQVLKVQMPYGDVFGLYGTTKPHSEEKVGEIMQMPFEEGTPEAARELGKLYNAGYNLGASLYLDFYMGKAVENWGPYQLPDNRILVIKEMRFLHPTEIWPDIKTNSEKIDIYAVYENVQFSTDLITCHTQYQGDVINGLRSWRIERDGKAVTDLSEIKAIGHNLAEAGIEQWQQLINLPEPELLEKAVSIRCFCFKNVCELLGLEWKPAPELLGAVKNKTLQGGWATWQHPSEPDAHNTYWRKISDPRIDFYP